MRLIMLPERRFILQQIEPLAVHSVRQSGPLAREQPDFPLEPRESSLAFYSELPCEQFKTARADRTAPPRAEARPRTPSQASIARSGYMWKSPPRTSTWCQLRENRCVPYGLLSFKSSVDSLARVAGVAPHNSGCCFRVGVSPSTQGAGLA